MQSETWRRKGVLAKRSARCRGSCFRSSRWLCCRKPGRNATGCSGREPGSWRAESSPRHCKYCDRSRRCSGARAVRDMS
ncbi:MAG: hypothetical protein CRU78_20085 [Candidatus Accumulibacter phosphatis]|uniref:Uncharacterized protein n=1 Tax=Candidatus Accumulibacter phosphatis TaxID=327160 RepID=A0A6A7RZA4_9PROT|nr:hypothetical protein [Candidatus Accumulibacter phosphatis]